MDQLIVFFGGIGDTILFAPTVKQLFNSGKITMIGYSERLALLKEAGWVEQIYSPEQVDFETIFSEPTERLKRFLNGYTKAFFFIRDTGNIVETARRCGIKEVFSGPGIPPHNWKLHASEYYLKSLGLEKEDHFILPIFAPSQHNKVVIHPGSGSPKKNFPIQFFVELTTHLQSIGKKVVWALGPAEDNINPPEGIEILNCLPLLDLARFLRGASLYIGNDSGISHIAGAIGVPTIALFKSTDPKVWKPLGPKVYVFQDTPDTLPKITRLAKEILKDHQ